MGVKNPYRTNSAAHYTYKTLRETTDPGDGARPTAVEGHEPPLPKERRRASIPCLPVDAKRSRHAPAPTTTRSRAGSSRAPRRLDARRRRSLSEFGLKYDDIRIESDADYAKALDRLQQCVQIKFNAALRHSSRVSLRPTTVRASSTTASPL